MSRLSDYRDAAFHETGQPHTHEGLPSLPPLPGGGGTTSETWRVPAGRWAGFTWSDLLGALKNGAISEAEIREIVSVHPPSQGGINLGPQAIEADITSNRAKSSPTHRAVSVGSGQWAIVNESGQRVSAQTFPTQNAAEFAITQGDFGTPEGTAAAGAIGGLATGVLGNIGEALGNIQGSIKGADLDEDQMKKLVELGEMTPFDALRWYTVNGNGGNGMSPESARLELIAQEMVRPGVSLEQIQQASGAAPTAVTPTSPAPSTSAGAGAPVNVSDGSALQNYAVEVANRIGIDPSKFLGLIGGESAWNPQATNPTSGAAGLGQFLPSTAQGYGVTPDQLRADPYLALDLAGQYLANSYQMHGDWDAALAAYFIGDGNIQNAIAQGGDNWLAVADQLAAQYGQGSVSDFFRSHNINAGDGLASILPLPEGPNVTEAQIRDYVKNGGDLAAAEQLFRERFSEKYNILPGGIDTEISKLRNLVPQAEAQYSEKQVRDLLTAGLISPEQAQQFIGQLYSDPLLRQLALSELPVVQPTPSTLSEQIAQSAQFVPGEGGRFGSAELVNRVRQSQGGLRQAIQNYQQQTGSTTPPTMAELAGYFGPTVGANTPVSRNVQVRGTDLSFTPEQAYELAGASPGERATGFRELTGSNLSFEEQVASLGTSNSGSGKGPQPVERSELGTVYDRYNQRLLDRQGFDPATADYRAKVLREEAEAGYSQARAGAESLAARLNTGRDPSGSGGFQVAGTNVQNKFGQIVGPDGTADKEEGTAALMFDDLARNFSITRSDEGFCVVGPDGTETCFPTIQEAEAQRDRSARAMYSISQAGTARTSRMAQPRSVTAMPETDGGGGGSRPARQRPVTPAPVTPEPVIGPPPNYGGGPVRYQPEVPDLPGFNMGGTVMGAKPFNFGRQPSMVVGEEIIGVGAQSGRPHFMMNEGPDGLGGQVVPEMLTIEPMGFAGGGTVMGEIPGYNTGGTIMGTAFNFRNPKRSARGKLVIKDPADILEEMRV